MYTNLDVAVLQHALDGARAAHEEPRVEVAPAGEPALGSALADALAVGIAGSFRVEDDAPIELLLLKANRKQ